MTIQLATIDEPPADRNGVVSPVRGIRFVTPPTTMNTCSPITNASPHASSRPNTSRAASAVRSPRSTRIAYRSSSAIRPVSPSSSPTAEMMKSDLAYGTRSGVP